MSTTTSLRTLHPLTLPLVLLIAVLAVVISPAQEPAPAQTQKANQDALRTLMDVYATAVKEADDKLASQVWCGLAEDSITNPAGRWQGPEQINAFYGLLRDEYSERKLTFDDISFHVYGDFAWTEFTGDFAARQRKDGTPVFFHAVETQIYRRAHDKWCLVHVQYSPFAPQAAGATK